ncbi:DUF2501 domain-containing protein [Lampropedia puyangensis]|uniref:DUF2501 domain-containing protein n=1 Tax=Lampropedia puyangensis TaxID=1330072 RepID=A0A4V4GSD8_9BURK|nr:DUF2501 domain-containing protein [Lampropedia puyangensis]THU04086.1 DUF2501 domain-containing protein [Lampropedia puyangensis]
MRFTLFRSIASPIAVAAALGVLAGSAIAQEDPLGALIEQKTSDKSGQIAVPAATGSSTSQSIQSATSATKAAAQAFTPADAGSGAAAVGTGSSLGGQAGGVLGAAAGALGAGGVGAEALSALKLPSLFGGSAGNVAGVLQYCVQNNYLNKAKANVNSVKDGLLKVAGLQDNPAPQSSNTNYANGLAGLLFGGEGETFDLNKVQSNLKEKACDYVLEQAPSLL